MDNCVKLWLWGVFAELGKSSGSVCAADCSRFDISSDTATASSRVGCLGDVLFSFFGDGFSTRQGEGRRLMALIGLVAH